MVQKNINRQRNRKFYRYLQDLSERISKITPSEQLKDDFIRSRVKVFKTDKQARVRARIDADRKGKVFDESETPPDELLTIEEDTIDELINMKFENLLED